MRLATLPVSVTRNVPSLASLLTSVRTPLYAARTAAVRRTTIVVDWPAPSVVEVNPDTNVKPAGTVSAASVKGWMPTLVTVSVLGVALLR